jgi:hypothetical protein
MGRWCFGIVLLLAAALSAQDRGPLNAALPRWATLHFESRFRAEGQHGEGFRTGSNSDFLLYRNRFSVSLNPAGWVQFYGEAQDARSSGIDQPNGSVRDIMDIRQAFVRVGSEESWWKLKVGRQKIAYGSERIIGGAEWGNTARVFDAAFLTLGTKKDKVDLFAASVVVSDADTWDHHEQGNNLHGIWGSFGSWIPGAKVEPLLLFRTNHRAQSNSWTGGLRSYGDIGNTWTWEFEALRQTGRFPIRDLSAWASTVQVQRHFKERTWSPSLVTEFNYATGDRNPNDGVVNTFDQYYPTNHGIYGLADQMARRNTRNVRTGVWMRPRSWLMVRAEHHAFWLASRYDALYQFNGAVSIPAVAGGASSTYVGREVDLNFDWKRSQYYSFGTQFGYFWSGSFVRQNSPGANRLFYALYMDFKL